LAFAKILPWKAAHAGQKGYIMPPDLKDPKHFTEGYTP
jgi:hypothetical protein